MTPPSTAAFNYSGFVIWAQLPLDNVLCNRAIPKDHPWRPAAYLWHGPKIQLNRPPMWFISPDAIYDVRVLLQVGARARQSRLFVPDGRYANLRLLGNLVS